MNSLLKTVGICALLTACSGGATKLQETERVESSSQPKTLNNEDRIDTVRALLLARHAADLPSKAILDRHQKADDSLRWLAANDNARVIRVRALTLL